MDQTSQRMLMSTAGYQGTPPGQQEYTTPGTYTWVAPAGVTSVSVVCIGAGASGGTQEFLYYGNPQAGGAGGAGGGLGYKNNISVVPGNSYSVVVGAGGVSLTSPQSSAQAGGESYFINTSTVRGQGGATGNAVTGGNFTGDGGGRGGFGNGGGGSGSGGGGGGGGYNGGDGTYLTSSSGGAPQNPPTAGVAGTNGAGGGGGASNSWGSSGAGGGVGILGQGANGVAGAAPAGGDTTQPTFGGGGGGGSGGTAGQDGTSDTSSPFTAVGRNGGLYGGGGGGNQNRIDASLAAGTGGNGAVRIIWPGNTRQFPTTLTGNL